MSFFGLLGACALAGKYYGGAIAGSRTVAEVIQKDVEWAIHGVRSDSTLRFVQSTSLVVLAVAAALFVLAKIIDRKYKQLVKGNTVHLDPWVQEPEGPTLAAKSKLLFAYRMSAGSHQVRTKAVLLGEQESTFMKGLKVTVKEGQVGSIPHALSSSSSSTRSSRRKNKKPIVVGTIRMGFGHHRIAYAACSWSLDHQDEHVTYFHDLLNIDTPEATLIKDMDQAYSKGSRLASELGGPFERLWGALTLSGGADSLRATYQMAEAVKPLLLGLPKDTPIVASHCLVALCAVACGFTNVINLVIDNHAQWFIVVPGALNLVQGPTTYTNLLKMGVPPNELRLAGHWIPKDLVDNLEMDCQARITRAKTRNKPLRLLLPVGGAGAQRKFVTNFVKALKGHLEAGDVQLFCNAADHEHMRLAFVGALDAIDQSYTVVDTEQGVYDFCDKLRSGKEPTAPVTVFAFKDYFPAVATTDLVGRVADVLACKPSELAFYPIPKLMIRRVGDHEQYSAIRASELGDGTLEARTIEDALEYVDLFQEPNSPLLVSMNEMIMRNGKHGIYDGCKNAIDIARQM